MRYERRTLMHGRRIATIVVCLAAAAATLTAVAFAAITPPPNIKSAGKLVFCSDITYPPEEYYIGSKAVGSDIDFGTEIAKLMGV
jgi:ABC-type amino acid transport substrate-binding protein